MTHASEHPNAGHSHPHPNYVAIFIALLILTAMTVGISRIHLGTVGNTILAVAVASVKGLLVAAYFMHLKFEAKHFVLLVCIPPLILFVLYIAGVMPDIGYLAKP